MPGLLAQGGAPGSLEFTATLFDLIRRGRYRADTGDDRAEDLGRPEDAAALRPRALARRRRGARRGVRGPVAQVVDSILADGPERLSRFRDRIEDDRTRNSERFTSFKSAVGTEVEERAGSRTSASGRCSAARPCWRSPAG